MTPVFRLLCQGDASEGLTWAVDLERLLGVVVGRWLGSLITSHPVPPSELRWEAWLRSPLFANGIDRQASDVRASALPQLTMVGSSSSSSLGAGAGGGTVFIDDASGGDGATALSSAATPVGKVGRSRQCASVGSAWGCVVCRAC